MSTMVPFDMTGRTVLIIAVEDILNLYDVMTTGRRVSGAC